MASPPWVDELSKHIGQHRIAGAENNPVIMAMFADIGATWATSDEWPYCGAAVGSSLKRSGIAILPPTEAPTAAKWMTYGDALIEPRRGAIAVWEITPGSYHVNFVMNDRGDTLVCIGGNQGGEVGHEVSIRGYPKSKLKALRWPKGVPFSIGETTTAELKATSRTWNLGDAIYKLGNALTGGQIAYHSINQLVGAAPTDAKPVALVAPKSEQSQVLETIAGWADFARGLKTALVAMQDLTAFVFAHFWFATIALTIGASVIGYKLRKWRKETADAAKKGAL